MKKLLRKVLLDYYDIRVKKSYEIGDHFGNRNFEVLGGQGKKYVVRLSPINKFEHLWLESYVLKMLRPRLPKDLLIPTIVKARSGKPFLRFEDSGITVFSFLHGRQANQMLSNGLDRLGYLRELGAKVAVLHKALSEIHAPPTGMDHQRLITSYLDRFNFYAKLGCYAYQNTSWRTVLARNMRVITGQCRKYEHYYDRYKGPLCFVHTDIKADNVLMQDGRISAFLDFDDLVVGDQAFDLAALCVMECTSRDERSNASGAAVDLDMFAQLLTGYFETSKDIRKASFLSRVINLLNLQALQVLYLVGKDWAFNPRDRAKNVVRYCGFLRATDARRLWVDMYSRVLKS